MTTLAQEFLQAARATPRLYFAPLIGAACGAIRGAWNEYQRVKALTEASKRSVQNR